MKISVLLAVIGVFLSNSFASDMEIKCLDSADPATQLCLKPLDFIDADSLEARENWKASVGESDLYNVKKEVLRDFFNKLDEFASENTTSSDNLKLVKTLIYDMIMTGEYILDPTCKENSVKRIPDDNKYKIVVTFNDVCAVPDLLYGFLLYLNQESVSRGYNEEERAKLDIFNR